MDPDKKPDTILKADNKTIFIVVVVFVVLVIAIFTYATATKNRPAESSQAPSQTSTTTTSPVAAQGLVSVTSSGFIPQTLSIRKGDQVKWTNTDQLPHRIISDSLASLNSGKPLNTGDSFIFTFGESGTFAYHDENNPEQFQGTIIVE